ncbi:hypothetical protein [Vogesella sp. AC12]|uniref:hypothetical protein n=1 Tax=Vogesella sp. AC12 TaxID=2950550 RepID=UPI00210C21BA|nr:hypothetical protein [Vogesella sp. AC12]MCQ4144436.1 hypothetical protein [Vogesella sp. AC12]
MLAVLATSWFILRFHPPVALFVLLPVRLFAVPAANASAVLWRRVGGSFAPGFQRNQPFERDKDEWNDPLQNFQRYCR